MKNAFESYQPSEEEIKKAEESMTPEQIKSSEERGLFVKQVGQLLEETRSGELTEEGMAYIDEWFEDMKDMNELHATQTLALYKDYEEDTVQGKFREIFSDPNSVSTLKNFALKTYEGDIDNPKSDSIKKLNALASFIKVFGGDDEIASRFSYEAQEPRTEIRSEEELGRLATRLGIDPNQLSREFTVVPPPRLVYTKPENQD